MFAAHIGGIINQRDPWYSNVSLLLHGNGSLADSSLNNFTVTAYNGATTTSTEPKYGSGCLINSAGRFQISPDSALNLTTASFTIELWVSVNSVTGYQVLVFQDDLQSTGQVFQFILSPAGKIVFVYFTSSSRTSGITLTGTTTISVGSWTHVAVSWDGSYIRIFMNGVLELSSPCSAMYTNNVITCVAGVQIGYPFNGKLDDVRLTKACRYISNFTPPTECPNS